MTNEEQIQEALARLMGRGDGAFTIFRDADSGRFVQFTGGPSEPLMLDLPKASLESKEFDRAGEFFRPFGPCEGEDSYMVSLARDARHAAGVATRVFAVVLGLPPNFPLEIQED